MSHTYPTRPSRTNQRRTPGSLAKNPSEAKLRNNEPAASQEERMVR